MRSHCADSRTGTVAALLPALIFQCCPWFFFDADVSHKVLLPLSLLFFDNRISSSC